MILDFDKSFDKQPSEQLTIRLELQNIYDSLVKSGYVLSSADLKIFNSSGQDVTETMLSGGISLDVTLNYVYATIINGTDGSDYFGRLKTTWTLATQPDQKPESDFLIRVRQKGF